MALVIGAVGVNGVSSLGVSAFSFVGAVALFILSGSQPALVGAFDTAGGVTFPLQTLVGLETSSA